MFAVSSLLCNVNLNLLKFSLGTESDFFAGYRACRCLEGFYRTDMFKECRKCGHGLECKDDHATLKSGYWWKWRNLTHKRRYIAFINNLLSPVPVLGEDDVQHPYPIPVQYKCPIEKSCKGGLNSSCEDGYEGPLCGVCSSGYYKQLQTCKRCPSKKWIAAQLSVIVAVFLIIIAASVWASQRNKKKNKDRSAIDIFFAKLKIIIGFYQVTYGLLEAFSYIQWPNSMQVIGRYSQILQLNILQMAPVHCLSSGLRVDAFGNLFAILAMNAAAIATSFIALGVRKLLISRNENMENEEKSRKVSQTKELVYRNLFFFLYLTYLNTCSMTATVLPLACWTLCTDEKDELCFKYLKADYSTRCHDARYNKLVILGYISTAYIIILPVATFFALWRQKTVIFAKKDSEASQDPVSSSELITGLSFLFESYKPRSWYWELVEMSRKVIVTSGLILVGQETRSYIGLALVIAGMYGIFFCWMRPLQDVSENRLMSTSLAVTIINLVIGAASRIPAENVPAQSNSNMDAAIFNVFVIGANTLLFVIPVGKIASLLH